MRNEEEYVKKSQEVEEMKEFEPSFFYLFLFSLSIIHTFFLVKESKKKIERTQT
jgi:hypothetical protein